jgi:putative transposase
MQQETKQGVNRMQLVEQHVIDRKDPRYAIIDAAAFKSKNLYNAALYEMRQAFIRSGIYLSYEEMDTRMQPSDKEGALARRKLRRLNGGS